MKRIYLLALTAILFTGSMFSQEDIKESIETSENVNEIKLNGLYLLLGAFDFAYERSINEESAVGLTVTLPFDDDVFTEVNYLISPYYRVYFGKKYAAGFFIEGFGMLNSADKSSIDFYPETLTFVEKKKSNIVDFALGIGLGGKWITNGGFVFDLNFGLGRNLFNNDWSDEVVLKTGFGLGYRF